MRICHLPRESFYISAHPPELLLKTSGSSAAPHLEAPCRHPRFVSYCMQKVCHQGVQFMLIWVQDLSGGSQLAVVVRRSGDWCEGEAGQCILSQDRVAL